MGAGHYINLGFSSGALGENAVAQYIFDMDISIFVCDYNHNAPDIAYLSSTHEKFYQIIRNNNKGLPIVLISRSNFDSNIKDSIFRRDIIYSTYMNAIRNGDANIYYVDGATFFKDENRDCCTVDGIHPNDAGFIRMAEVIGNILKRILIVNGEYLLNIHIKEGPGCFYTLFLVSSPIFIHILSSLNT